MEGDDDRKTFKVLKNNEAVLVICCLYQTEDRKSNYLRMDYSEYHDRWANCDYEASFTGDSDIESIYKDIVFWIEKADLITEDFYSRYSEQEFDLNEYMKRNLAD